MVEADHIKLKVGSTQVVEAETIELDKCIGREGRQGGKRLCRFGQGCWRPGCHFWHDVESRARHWAAEWKTAACCVSIGTSGCASTGVGSASNSAAGGGETGVGVVEIAVDEQVTVGALQQALDQKQQNIEASIGELQECKAKVDAMIKKWKEIDSIIAVKF